MLSALLAIFVLLAAVIGFLVLVCRRLAAQSVDEVYEDAQHRSGALRCPLCRQVQFRGAQHGFGQCATRTPPPPPIEAT